MGIVDVYECYFRTSPVTIELVHYAASEQEAIEKLLDIGGGVYRNIKWTTRVTVVNKNGDIL